MGEIIKFIFKYSWAWMLCIIIFKTYEIYNKSDKEENSLIFKLIGYYILGGFSFAIHDVMPFPIIIPVGILVYVLTIQDKEKQNKEIKDKIARFAFLMLCLGSLCDFINYYIEYRVVYIKDSNMKMESLYDDYIKIKDKLKIEEELAIYNFSAFIEENNKIESVMYTLRGIEKDYVVSYTYFDEEDKSISVEPMNNEDNIKYEGMSIEEYMNQNYYSEYIISPEDFLEYISNIDFMNEDKLRNEKIVGNYITYYNHFSSDISELYGDSSIYYVDKNKDYYSEEIKKEMLPVSGIILRNSYMQEVEENFSQGIYEDIYVINPMFEYRE